jgi:hypothetical protein
VTPATVPEGGDVVKKYVVLAALVLAVPAPAALARRPAPPERVFAGTTDQGLPAYVKVLSHNRGVETVVAYAAKCDSGGVAILWGGATKLSVRKGRFSFARSEDDRGPQITLHGRIGKKSVSGSWNASFTIRDDSGAVTDHCDTGLVNWTLKKPPFGGQSSDGYPIVMSVAKGKVRSIQLVTDMKCQSGSDYFMATPYADFAVARDGSFGDSFTDTGHPGPGMQSKITIDISGKVGRKGASGTWHMSAVISDASGNQVDSCDSGSLTWHAER